MKSKLKIFSTILVRTKNSFIFVFNSAESKYYDYRNGLVFW